MYLKLISALSIVNKDNIVNKKLGCVFSFNKCLYQFQRNYEIKWYSTTVYSYEI